MIYDDRTERIKVNAKIICTGLWNVHTFIRFSFRMLVSFRIEACWVLRKRCGILKVLNKVSKTLV